ncbi:hypothetical protein A8C75_10155 [Marinobacterium aestuarii]|uniref:Uncharacterized protein n=1 Tax=Marinobacterium aestuarii TaxID=1821621 RepID=A0A1A9EYT7_9GAMM|nr:hypothetical protein [Marinobacterium aestuarii]ANG62811.1 hypothetical protein A8C75_10155 [Marinobacterium aestuarii]
MPDKTILDVVDTAVKIGIGALISGVSTYWVTKLKNSADAEKEYRQRYRSILEEVADNLESVNHVYLKYWALVVEWLRYKNGNNQWPETRKEELEKVKEELFHAFKAVTSAEAKLLLVGESRAYEALRAYAEKVIKFRRTFYCENMKMTEAEMETAKSEIKELRESFFRQVSDSYKHRIT